MARKICSSSFKKDILLEVAYLVENLDALAFPVSDVQDPVVRDSHTVHNHQKNSTHSCVAFSLCSLAAKLADVVAVAIEDHDAAVAVTVGDIHVAVGGINRET